MATVQGFLPSLSLTIIGILIIACSRSQSTGAPNDNFRKISVRKTIGDLEFSEHVL